MGLHTRKAFAYATKEKALNSFKIRNSKRIGYLKHDLQVAEMAKLALDNLNLYEGGALSEFALLNKPISQVDRFLEDNQMRALP